MLIDPFNNVNRMIHAFILASCLAVLGFGLYLQHFVGLKPCPLCILQRIAFMVIMVIALAATVHASRNFGGYLYDGLIAVTAALGGGIAGRQIWLQHLPAEQVPACGPELAYLLETFPPLEVLSLVLAGSGECAEVQWRFLGLSIPEWSLIWFIFFFIIASISILIRRHGGQVQ